VYFGESFQKGRTSPRSILYGKLLPLSNKLAYPFSFPLIITRSGLLARGSLSGWGNKTRRYSMNTAERIKELANKLSEEADYYGAYIDELRKAAEKPEDEFIKECEIIDLKYPSIDKKVAQAVLVFLLKTCEEMDEAESASKSLN